MTVIRTVAGTHLLQLHLQQQLQRGVERLFPQIGRRQGQGGRGPGIQSGPGFLHPQPYFFDAFMISLQQKQQGLHEQQQGLHGQQQGALSCSQDDLRQQFVGRQQSVLEHERLQVLELRHLSFEVGLQQHLASRSRYFFGLQGCISQ